MIQKIAYCQVLGCVLWRHRKSLGLTSRQLASAAGISSSMLSRIETGRVSLKICTLRDFDRSFLPVSLVEVLEEVDDIWDALWRKAETIPVPFVLVEGTMKGHSEFASRYYVRELVHRESARLSVLKAGSST